MGMYDDYEAFENDLANRLASDRTVSSRAVQRQDINTQIEEFFKKGGEIQVDDTPPGPFRLDEIPEDDREVMKADSLPKDSRRYVDFTNKTGSALGAEAAKQVGGFNGPDKF